MPIKSKQYCFTSPFFFQIDLRRPRSEPSCYYVGEAQGDGPVTKKHKPNPEAASLGVDQLTQRPKSSPPKAPRESGSDRDVRDGGQPGARQGGSSGRLSWKTGSGRKGAAASGGGTLGKERLASRLRMQEASGTGDVSEMFLSGQENMENTEDLQVWTAIEHEGLWRFFIHSILRCLRLLNEILKYTELFEIH